MISRVLGIALVAGFLADLLANTDPDVEAGIDAYEAGDHDAALASFDAAIERLGDRPELAFDRGLALLGKGDTEGARAAFQRATEADAADVRASALYELGNLELDAEAWDAAIERYTECLKANPEHFSAKWNLELAQKRKEEKEDEDESSSSEDSGGSEESGGSETGGSEGESGESGGEESGKDEETGKDQGESGGEPPPEEKQDEKQDEKQEPPQPEPKPVDRVDLERALEQLDEQDEFLHAQPRGRLSEPAKDW